MAPNFSKNAILEGCVSSDFFCLVCEKYFTSAVKCEEHISGSDHKAKINSITYVEDFKEDGIKKIKNKYFCELCNQLMSVLARVKLHINEISHIKKKYLGWLKRVDNVVVAFDSIMIDDTSWQGLCDNSCTICNLEYEDEDAHKNSPAHKLNLIQSKVEFDENKNIYRKIDDNSIQCLTCNLVQTLDNNHFESPKHKQMIQVANDGYKALTQSNKFNVNLNDNSKIKPTYDYDDEAEEKVCKVFSADNYISYDANNITWCILCDWVLDVSMVRKHINGEHHQTILDLHKKRLAKLQMINSNHTDDDCEQQKNTLLDLVDKFQSNGININFEAQTAVCKKCLTSLKLEHDAIEIHILSHNKQLKKGKKSVHLKFPNKHPEKKGTLVSSPVFLKPGGVEQPSEGNSSKSSEVPNDSNNTASTDVVLDIEPPSTPKIKKTKDPMPEKIPLKDFIESIVGVKNVIFKDVIINSKFCLNNFSFVFLTLPTDDIMIKCYACDEDISYTTLAMHSKSPKHERAMRDSLVLTQYDTEFIRETPCGCLHCGYCNIIETSWNEMEAHLKTSMHIESKDDASWRLQQYQPVFLQNTSPRTIVHSLQSDMVVVKFL